MIALVSLGILAYVGCGGEQQTASTGQETVSQPALPPQPPKTAGNVPQAGFEIGDLAPEIVGEDVDGTEFKLSDYRGKVVVLDFWGDW